VFALVRDRGRGFDLAVHNGSDRHGVLNSIDARMRQQGGTATIRSAVGEGTEVELRMPVGA
jgi:signal transduction histidine kinase